MFNDGRQEAIADPENPQEQDIDPNYKTYQVYSPKTQTLVTLRGRDLYNTEYQTETQNTAIANREQDESEAYQKQVREREAKAKEYDAVALANQSKINGLFDENENLQTELGNLQTPKTAEEQSRKEKVQAQIAANNKAIRDLGSENTKIFGQKDALPVPVKPKPNQRIATPQAVGTYSESQFRKIMADDGKTPAQIELLVKQGKSQGIIK
jgi:hypothetical protein